MSEHPTPRQRRDQLLHILQDGQLHQAAALADQLAISQRSLYRDIQQLRRSGIPVNGQPGVGYRLARAHYLPPLALSSDELEALHLGLAILREGADETLRNAAETLGAKIDAALDVSANEPDVQFGRLTPNQASLSHVATLRSAITARQMVELQAHRQTQIARPLELRFEGRDWRAVLYAETSAAFLSVPLAQISTIRALPQLFTDSPGKTLDDYRRPLLR